MRFLRTNTAVRVTVGPFFDKTDGVTPETGITVTSCKLTLMVDDANVPTLVLDTAPTASGGANDMVHVTGDDAGFYDLELAAANVNYLGRAMLAITDAAVHCPVFHEFMILPAMIYDSLILGTDRLDTNVTHIGDTSQTARDIGASVLLSSGTGTGQLTLSSGVASANAVQISGDSTAADNLETAYDDTAGAVPWVGIIDQGTAQAATGTTLQLRLAASFGDDTPIGATLMAFGSTQGYWQVRPVTDYVSATDTATVPTWAVTPSGTITYKMFGSAAGASLAEIADAVWDEALSGHTTAGTAGKALTDAGSAGDPWSTTVPGAYGAGTAGSRLGRIPDIAAGGAGGLFVAGTNAATTVTTALTTTFTGSLTGSVGSVAGSVGSVTGAVGSVTGAVGSVTGAVGSVTGNVGGNVTGSVGSLATQAKTDVNNEMLDVLVTDAFTQPSSVPAATTSIKNMLGWLYTLGRNKITQTSSTQLVRNDADNATIGTSTVSDDATTGSREKFV